MDYLNYLYQAFLEPEHFPGWEIFILLNMCFWISVVIRLNRIEGKLVEEDDMEGLTPCCNALYMQMFTDICSECREHTGD